MKKHINQLWEDESILARDKEELNIIYNKLHELGYKWCSGKTYLEDVVGDFTNEGVVIYPHSGTYGSKHCATYYYTIEEIADFDTGLPERWFVKPTTPEQRRIVGEYIDKHKSPHRDFIYANCPGNWGFAFPERFYSHLYDCCPVGYTELSFEEWQRRQQNKQNNNNNMKNFSIEGTESLKKALVEETGVGVCSSGTITNSPYLTNYTYYTAEVLSGINTKQDLHFILPQDWDEAVEHVRQWMAPKPEYKEGDYITVVKGCDGYNGEEGRTYRIIRVDGNSLFYDRYNSIGIDQVIVRPATEEEIKPPIVHGYEGTIEGDTINYGCKSFNIEDIEALHKLIERMNITQVNFQGEYSVQSTQIDEVVRHIKQRGLLRG